MEPGPVTQGIYERLLNLEETQPTIAPLRTAAPLLGRQADWEALQALWRQTQSGQPRLLLLAGEAGISNLPGRGISGLGRTPGCGHGHSPLLCGWWTLCLGARARMVACTRFSEKPANGRCCLAQRSRAPPPRTVDRAAGARHAADAGRKLATATALRGPGALTVQGQPPLLLLLDDIQWCDEDTLDRLHYLLRFDPNAVAVDHCHGPPGRFATGTTPAGLSLPVCARPSCSMNTS